jgi:uncharacterized protein YggE
MSKLYNEDRFSGLSDCMFFQVIILHMLNDNNSNPAHNNTTNADNALSLISTATTTVKPDKVTVSSEVKTTNKTSKHLFLKQ